MAVRQGIYAPQVTGDLLKEARTLFEAAERDLSALRSMHDSTVFADEIFGFHAQQAAEKLLKAWLTRLGESYPLTPNISRLVRLLQDHDATATRFRSLNEYSFYYAVQFRRGPSDFDEIPLNRDEALQRLDALYQHVRQRLTETEGG